MGKFLGIFVALLTIYVSYVAYNSFSNLEPPTLPEFYWGPKGKEKQKEDTTIRPFKVNVDQKVLDDLQTRLKLEIDNNRLIPPLEGIGFQYGFNSGFLKTVTNHWLTKYDWKAREKELNKYPHFKTTISGIEIHFQHVKSLSKKAYKQTRPLLLLHGWPGSIVEFQKVIPLLTDPKGFETNFELVIPSLPGYGFSERSPRPGLGAVETAQLFLKLMKRLGHEKFYVQGGDWGSLIGSNMGSLYPNNTVGFHSNNCFSMHPLTHLRHFLGSIYPKFIMPEDEIHRMYPVSTFFSKLIEETGYAHIQATKPDTIGASLSNSPTGLAAYILEKFSTWTNYRWKVKEDGGLVPYYKLDELLDNIMVYWVTNTITSSVRFYSENLSQRQLGYGMDRVPVNVPTGCLTVPDDFLTPTEFHIRDKFPQIISYTKAKKGGHFAAFEVPDILAEDVINFFNLVEKNYNSFNKK